MLHLRHFAGCTAFVLALCLAPEAWAQEAEEPAPATAEDPKVDAFQYLFGRREDSPEQETEKEEPAEVPSADPEAKRDAFQYLFGRRTQPAASGEQTAPAPEQPVKEEPAKAEPAKRPAARKQPAQERRQPVAPPVTKAAPVTAPSPAPAPTPAAAPKPLPAEPKPEAASPSLPEEPQVEEKPKVDAFQYFFGQKEKQGEPADPEPEKTEESERPPI